MFAGLSNYKTQAFYDENPTFRLFTPQADYEVKIFAGYVADLQDQAWEIQFNDDTDFNAWINDRIQKSMFNSNITPTAEDKIITLSTCSYEFDDARFVLFGVIQN